MDVHCKKLDREIEKVLVESGYKERLSHQLEKTIALMQENLPELKKTLQVFQLSSAQPEDQHSVIVDKTVFINGSNSVGKDTEVGDRREQPSKTSRRKTHI